MAVRAPALAVLLCAALAAGFIPPQLRPPLFPLPVPAPSAEARPQKHFTGSVCPPETTCVRPQDCSRQCRPGWDSFGLGSCYWVPPAEAAAQTAAQTACAALGAHLPVIENTDELSRLLVFGAQWTNATWDAQRSSWVWSGTRRPVQFSALGTARPADGSATVACLVADPGPPAFFIPTDCTGTALYICETGSPSVSSCAGQSGRICCAVSADHYGEPCYIDEQGTRCEQRIREGYFPLGESLVRPTEGTDDGQLSWAEARALCRADGGDLLVIDDIQMDERIRSMLSELAPLGATEFYIGLSSDAAGAFSYVNGTAAAAGSAYLNFATAADAARPNSCAFYSGRAWASGDCSVARDFVCHIRRVRHSLRQEPRRPRCGVRHPRGVLGKSSARFAPPPLPLPQIPPPPGGDDRRGAAQFGEITWQAAIWIRSGASEHEFACSGALVHSSWVLTAARCVADTEPADIKVTVGDWNLDETRPVSLPPVAVDVTRIRTSPGRVSHGPFGPVLEPGRLAMLRITPELDGDEYPHVGPVCLPDTSLLQDVHQLRCVVTGWRGGLQPTHQPWRQQPNPDMRDILRKFETGVRHDPDCQDLAHHLKHLKQRPPQPPPFAPPFPGPYPWPPRPVPFSVEGRDALEPRDGFSFRPPPFFGAPPPPLPPPAASDQPELFICPREPRCIPDQGALLACALPPPPPPPPLHRPPVPRPPPFFRSAQNETEDDTATAETTTASVPTGPVDAYEQLSKGFRPPVDKKTAAKRARRSLESGGEPSAPVAAAAASAEGAAGSAPAQTPVEGPGVGPARSAAPEGDFGRTDGRAAFVLPHSIIGAFHSAPPPLAGGGLGGGLGPDTEPASEPATAGSRHYDAYVLVGVASSATDGCVTGRMVFDDIIQESEFIQQVVHRGG
ncbi:uncharacterized protein LOC122381264 [Amphibalanus amphitrite]|uniref:uncharacterized protein LOC122381264 n=1 Tax=Amphibalanus amphitrite TaxID=1232801 RepID=UPI001C92438C|nr:uncharacterized protein LOC122381264 [Amphibalanus amphitrite]